MCFRVSCSSSIAKEKNCPKPINCHAAMEVPGRRFPLRIEICMGIDVGHQHPGPIALLQVTHRSQVHRTIAPDGEDLKRGVLAVDLFMVELRDPQYHSCFMVFQY